MNGQNLTVYDFVVDIVPGALAIVLTLSLLPAEAVNKVDVSQVTVGSSVLIVVFGYFVGHMIQAFASPIDNAVYMNHKGAYPFERALSGAKNGSVKKKFADNIDSFFTSEEGGELRDFEKFKLTQSYLWNNNIGRAQRFQVLYTFLRSMWVLLIGAALLHTLGLIAHLYLDYGLLWTPLQSFVLIFSLAGIGVIIYFRRVKYHDMMVDALIFDFYANILNDEEENDGKTVENRDL
jgi:hypothetical protein